MAPRVSVIVPVHNRPQFVREAIASALAQECPGGLEVVAVDDGSTDATPEVLASFGAPVRVFRQTNAGPSRARNRALAEAQGELVALLDSDDVWLPGKLAAQLAVLDAAPDACLVHSDVDEFWDDGSARRWERRPPVLAGWVLRDLLRRNFVHTMTVVLRRRAALEAGGFDPAFPPCEDWDLWLRLAARHPFAADPERRVRVRIHPGSISADPIVVGTQAALVLAAAAERLASEKRPEEALARRQAARRLVKLGKRLARAGRAAEADAEFARAAELHPFGRIGAALARIVSKRRGAPAAETRS